MLTGRDICQKPVFEKGLKKKGKKRKKEKKKEIGEGEDLVSKSQEKGQHLYLKLVLMAELPLILLLCIAKLNWTS